MSFAALTARSNRPGQYTVRDNLAGRIEEPLEFTSLNMNRELPQMPFLDIRRLNRWQTGLDEDQEHIWFFHETRFVSYGIKGWFPGQLRGRFDVAGDFGESSEVGIVIACLVRYRYKPVNFVTFLTDSMCFHVQTFMGPRR